MSIEIDNRFHQLSSRRARASWDENAARKRQLGPMKKAAESCMIDPQCIRIRNLFVQCINFVQSIFLRDMRG
jgi:hypothetical protein